MMRKKREAGSEDKATEDKTTEDKAIRTEDGKMRRKMMRMMTEWKSCGVCHGRRMPL
jgi:hypothetical protein